jgi:hypothetical protein
VSRSHLEAEVRSTIPTAKLIEIDLSSVTHIGGVLELGARKRKVHPRVLALFGMDEEQLKDA